MCCGKNLLHGVLRGGAGRGKAHSATARLAPSPLPPRLNRNWGQKKDGDTPRKDTRINASRSSTARRRESNWYVFVECALELYALRLDH